MSETAKKSDLIPRLITAIVGIPILLGIAFAGPNWAVWLVVALAASAGAWEYVTMTLGGDRGVDGNAAVVAVFVTLAALYWCDASLPLVATAFLSTVGLMALVMLGLKDTSQAARRTGAVLGAYTYMSVLFGVYALLILDPAVPRTSTAPHQAGWFLLPMFIVWAGDTGAYFAGRALGRHKLAPMVSPGKTWEGAAGGVLASVAGGYLALAVLPLPDIAWQHVLIYAIPGAIIGQVGDLCESMIKRATGYKDSGSIIYGHGGMLDRVDALIFAAPWIYIARQLLGDG